jgi:hypothetical protein
VDEPQRFSREFKLEDARGMQVGENIGVLARELGAPVRIAVSTQTAATVHPFTGAFPLFGLPSVARWIADSFDTQNGLSDSWLPQTR